MANLTINRKVIFQEDIRMSDSFFKGRSKRILKSFFSSISCIKILYSLFPILEWIQEYNIKRDFLFDLIAGMTVTIIQVPQSFAYGLLANVPPICGLYAACFDTFVYVVFGTCRHASVGTFAVVCLMVGKTVGLYSKLDSYGEPFDHPGELSEIGNYKDIEILSALTITIAFFQFAIFTCRLGIMCCLVSQPMVNAFSTACSVHIIITQFKEFFGIQFRSQNGYFRIIYVIYNICINLPNTNLVTVSLAIVALTLLVLCNEFVKPVVIKKCPFPLPTELIVVLIAILLSYFLNLEGNYNVKIIKYIPNGIPEFSVPKFEIIPHIVVDAMAIALVSYVISQSINMIFSKKGDYKLDTNQEAFAMGAMNLLGSFISAVPTSTSLVRSIITFNVGGLTQIAAVITALFLLLIIICMGPIFELLPLCILSSIILSAVYRSFFEVKRFIKFWKHSKMDGIIWLITFWTVVLVDISIGIFVALASAICILIIHSCKPHSCLLGVVPGTEIYLDSRRFIETQEIPRIKIFRFEGGYNFGSQRIFNDCIYKTTGVDAEKIITEHKRAERKLKKGDESLEGFKLEIGVIIIDCSGVSQIDPSAIQNLKDIEFDYNYIGVTVLIACASGNMYQALVQHDRIEKTDHKFKIFPTIHDAVLYAQAYILTTNK